VISGIGVSQQNAVNPSPVDAGCGGGSRQLVCGSGASRYTEHGCIGGRYLRFKRSVVEDDDYNGQRCSLLPHLASLLRQRNPQPVRSARRRASRSAGRA